MKYVDKSFSTYAPGDDAYRTNWEATFGVQKGAVSITVGREPELDTHNAFKAVHDWKAAAKEFRKNAIFNFRQYQQYRRMYRVETGELPGPDEVCGCPHGFKRGSHGCESDYDDAGYEPRRRGVGAAPTPSKTRFTVELDRETDGRWIAEVVDVPGAMAYGDSRAAAMLSALVAALWSTDKTSGEAATHQSPAAALHCLPDGNAQADTVEVVEVPNNRTVDKEKPTDPCEGCGLHPAALCWYCLGCR